MKLAHEWDNSVKLVVENGRVAIQKMHVYGAAFSLDPSEVAPAVPSVDVETLSTLGMTPLFSSRVSSSPD